MEIKSFDHVALWTDARDELATLLTEFCGMHVVAHTSTFTLVGGDARRGKLTFFDAEGPREQGVLERIVLRVPRLDDVKTRLAQRGIAAMSDEASIQLEGPSGVPLAVVESPTTGVPDLDRVVLRVPDPHRTATRLAVLGPERVGPELRIGDRRIVLRSGKDEEAVRPLLNHLAFLVESVGRVLEHARSRGLEVEEVIDAPNTIAVFLRGPDGLRLEYVEHKPGFALE